MQVMIIGGGGIASALMQYYLAIGCRVVVWSRQQQLHHADASTLVNNPNLQWYCTQEMTEDDYQPALQQLFSQPISLIYCCIGFLHQGSDRPEKTIKSLTANFMLENLQANTVEPALWLSRLMPFVIKQPGLKMLWLSAKVGSISDNQLGGWYSYRASKAALNMFVKTAAIELRRLQPELILVTVHPGTTDTALSQPFQQNLPKGQLQTVEATAQRLASVADNLVAAKHGLLLNWDGQVLPF
jgi:NAD(P)-dependent dehydrogenase (short-subunit alcohol dehydrogenase family)